MLQRKKDLSLQQLTFNLINGNSMVTKIEIKDWITKEIIFSYECKNNTFIKTVEEAVKQKVNLVYADLRCANLYNVDLSHADLSCANLNMTDLRCADLSNSDLSHADLRCTNLYKADLRGAKIDYPMGLPEGEFIAWKKVFNHERLKPYIVKLKILADSKRSRATSDKCRCDKALVMEIQDLDSNKLDLTEVTNNNYIRSLPSCTYKVGEIVYADEWDENRFNECSHGIHFFLDREKAVNY